jgi:hypothetical protein
MSGSLSDAEGEASGSTDSCARSGSSVQDLYTAVGMLLEVLKELNCRTDNAAADSITAVSRFRSQVQAVWSRDVCRRG